MGKRQLGELQPSELVITILISNIASLPIEDPNIPMILGIIPVLTLVAFEIFVSNISLQSKGFRSFISGSPVVVIHSGEVDQKQLRRLRFSIDDLMESLRQQGVFDIREVEYAIVETTGKVSVLQKFSSQTVTASMLSLKGESKDPPIVIISDGRIISSALDEYNIETKWLFKTLEKEKCKRKDVFLFTCDRSKNYYLVKKDNSKK